MNPSELRQCVDLVEYCHSARISLQMGYNDCPFCGRTKKLKVTSTWWKCFHPGCPSHKKLRYEYGNIYDLIQICSNVNFSEAYRRVQSFYDPELSKHSSSLKTTRHKVLSNVFSYYANYLQDEVLDYLNSRLLFRSLESLDFGYAPPLDVFNPLDHFSIKELDLAGLLTKNKRPLFQNRVIFPIWQYGNIVHMQGRSLDPDDDLRWLSTLNKSVEDDSQICKPISECLYGIDLYKKEKAIIITEGIIDALSLRELGFPAVSTFGVSIDFRNFLSFLEGMDAILFLFDSDRYPLLSPYENLYKSWLALFPYLTKLRGLLPHKPIFCMLPPKGTDMNEALVSGMTDEEFRKYLRRASLLEQFYLDNFFLEEYIPNLVRLCSHNSKYSRVLRDAIEENFEWYEILQNSMLALGD
jgi:hypothetical protein